MIAQWGYVWTTTNNVITHAARQSTLILLQDVVLGGIALGFLTHSLGKFFFVKIVVIPFPTWACPSSPSFNFVRHCKSEMHLPNHFEVSCRIMQRIILLPRSLSHTYGQTSIFFRSTGQQRSAVRDTSRIPTPAYLNLKNHMSLSLGKSISLVLMKPDNLNQTRLKICGALRVVMENTGFQT